MAIIIPSKNIYSKSNNKIADNNIQKIEVNATEIKFENIKNSTAYSETIRDYTPITKTSVVLDFAEKTIGSVFNIVGIKAFNPTFIEKTITIPKVTFDRFAKELYSGQDSDSINYINVVVQAQKYIGNATGIININTSEILDISSSNIQKDNTVYISSQSFKYSYTLSDDSELTASVSTIDTSNVSTQEFYSDENNYYIDLSILVGFEKIGLFGTETYSEGTGYPIVNGTGVYEKYEFIQAEITFNGEIIKVTASDSQLSYGTNNKNTFSIQGNELMQTTNYTSNGIGLIESNVTNTIEQYSNGKETAVLRCDIGDYYDEENNAILFVPKTSKEIKAINNIKISVDKGSVLEQAEIVYDNVSNLYIPTSIVTNDSGNATMSNFYFIVDSNQNATIHSIDLDDDRYYVHISTDKLLDYDLYCRLSIYANTGFEYTDQKATIFAKLPAKQSSVNIWTPINLTLTHTLSYEVLEKFVRAVFQEGDIVIPMVRNKNGIDEPMSRNSDNSAKYFEVLSTNIYSSGVVWQELKLQEYKVN